jgi:hypothetical protein
MRKTILLALLAVAVAAAPAFASVQNVKVSGSIDSTYIYRENFDLGLENTTTTPVSQIEDTHQSDLITQATLRVDADLTDQVSTTIQLINERVWEQDSGATNSGVDLNLAFVTLREMLYSPLTVIVGRQAFHYGNSLVIDSNGPNNAAPADSGITNVADDLTKQKAQDAVRLIFDYNPLTLEVLYSKIDTGTAGATEDHITDDVNLYGINGNYELGDSMNSVVEAYFFARIDQSTNDGGTGEGTKSDTTYVPGFRVSTSPIEGLNVQTELAWQRGNNVSSSTTTNDNEQREAMAAQFIANYQVPVLEEYKPVAQYMFTHLSGDSNPNDRQDNSVGPSASVNRDTAWDPMYENQSGGKIYNTLLNHSNANIHEVSLQVNPVEDVTTKVTWTGLWLDKKIDAGNGTLALLQPNAATTGNLSVDTGKKGSGYEVDVDAIYDYTEDVQIGASLGWFVPGNVFNATNDSVASQAIVHGNVNF